MLDRMHDPVWMEGAPPFGEAGSLLERFLLARLWRFARLAARDDFDVPPAWRKLARHATLSAYRDCIAFGLEREARLLVEQATRTPAAYR